MSVVVGVAEGYTRLRLLPTEGDVSVVVGVAEGYILLSVGGDVNMIVEVPWGVSCSVFLCVWFFRRQNPTTRHPQCQLPAGPAG